MRGTTDLDTNVGKRGPAAPPSPRLPLLLPLLPGPRSLLPGPTPPRRGGSSRRRQGGVALGISARVLTPLPGKLIPLVDGRVVRQTALGPSLALRSLLPCSPPTSVRFPGQPDSQAGSLVSAYSGDCAAKTPRGTRRDMGDACWQLPERSPRPRPLGLRVALGPWTHQRAVGVCIWA